MQNVNQFSQTHEKGHIDTKIGGVIIPCKLTGPAKAGASVKLVDSASKEIEVVEVATQADVAFGVIVRDYKKSSYVAGDFVEVLVKDGIMRCEASEAIARGAEVSYVITGQKVESADATECVIGTALDKASADGDLIRVLINCQGKIKA